VTPIQRLPLQQPSGIAGAKEGIWIADAGSRSAVLFDAASAAVRATVALDDAPGGIAAAGELIAIALRSGDVIAVAAGDGQRRWRRSVSSDVALGASRDRVWAWDRDASRFLAWDQSGSEEQFEAADAVAFAPTERGVYSLTSDAVVRFQARAGASSSARLPDSAAPLAALLFCANSLWVGVADGLMLVARDTLEARATLRVPEPAVTHLICYGGRVFGGGRSTIFSIEPAADDNARSLGIRVRSPLLGLAVSGRHLWALEHASPEVHVVQIP
jgi:hypothetical protein